MAMCRVVLAGCLFCAWPAFFWSSALSPSAPAAYQGNDEMNFTLEGKITEKTGTKLTVSSSDNIIFHVVYNDKTEIKKKDGSAGTGDDLHTGVSISVAGDLAESGEITAKKIAIESDGSGKQ